MVHINFIIPVSADKKYAATTHLVREEGVDDVKSRIICPLQVVQEQLCLRVKQNYQDCKQVTLSSKNAQKRATVKRI